MRGAALPDRGYARPQTLIRTGDSIVVLVFPERGNGQQSYSFHKLRVGPELQLALAEGFARATGPSGSRRTQESAASLYNCLRSFANLIDAENSPPRTLSDLRPSHIAALRLRHTKASQSIVMAIRTTLRANDSLPGPFRDLLYAPMKSARSVGTVASYSESEFRAIRRSARSDIRVALNRVRTMETELTAWLQRGNEDGDAEVARRGHLLEFIAANGDVPRTSSGIVSRHPAHAGSVELLRALFPTLSELTAVIVLMQCLTGQNLSVICALTTVHLRADNQEGEGAVVLTRAQKPRRGRYDAEMDLSFTSMPVWLDEGGIEDKDDYGSPFGLYKIAEELCRRAREFTRTEVLLCAFSDKWRETTLAGLGFRAAKPNPAYWKGWTYKAEHRDFIDTMRLRRTYLEFRQRPVAQKVSTFTDTYLTKDQGSLATYQAVVGAALSDEAARIRATNSIRTLNEEEVRQALKHPESLATHLGLSVGRLQDLLAGRLDTIAAACIDPHNGPHDPAGQPCTASFLLCLSCPNARSEPRHIPVQALLSKQIQARQLDMPSEQWSRRFQVADDQLRGLLIEQRADVDEMALQATEDDLRLIEALLDGRYDV